MAAMGNSGSAVYTFPNIMSNLSSNLTLATWVKLQHTSFELNYQPIVAGNCWSINCYSFVINVDGSYIVINYTMPVGQWVHLAGVCGILGGRVYVSAYVNGIAVGYYSRSATVIATADLGRSINFLDPAFHPQTAADIRIYNAALTEAEIQQIYNFAGNDSVNRNLLIKYRTIGVQGSPITILNDSSGNNYNAYGSGASYVDGTFHYTQTPLVVV